MDKPVAGKRYPRCIGGAGACPPEDCGGSDAYHARRDEATGSDAIDDLVLVAEFVERVVLGNDSSWSDDDETRWRVEMAAERIQSRARFLEEKFSRGCWRSTGVSAPAPIGDSCISRPCEMAPVRGQQVGRNGADDVPVTNARIGAFKPIADFDWAWPKRTDRPLIEELFSLAFVDDATNVVLVGPFKGSGFMMHTCLRYWKSRTFCARLRVSAPPEGTSSLSRASICASGIAHGAPLHT